MIAFIRKDTGEHVTLQVRQPFTEVTPIERETIFKACQLGLTTVEFSTEGDFKDEDIKDLIAIGEQYEFIFQKKETLDIESMGLRTIVTFSPPILYTRADNIPHGLVVCIEHSDFSGLFLGTHPLYGIVNERVTPELLLTKEFNIEAKGYLNRQERRNKAWSEERPYSKVPPKRL